MAFETQKNVSELEAELDRLRNEELELNRAMLSTKKEVDLRMERKYESHELERAKEYSAADQPGWESPAHRTALRNMRSTDMIQAWYQYMPEMFENELLTETIMQGVWTDVRKSDKFDSGFKDRMRVKKRQYIRYNVDLTLGFHPTVTKRLSETHGYKLDELRKLANARLTELGPDGEGFYDPKDPKRPINYFNWFGRDFVYKGKTRNIAEEYQAIIEEHNAMVPPEEKIEDKMTPFERSETYYAAGEKMWDIVSQNLADDEFKLMPTSLRQSYLVRRRMDVNKLQHYRDRDLDEKIPMVEFFIEQFRDEVLGVRKATKENLSLFTWFVNEMGKSFITFESLRADLKEPWWEIIKSLLGRPNDARGLPTIYGYIQDELSGGDDSKVMRKINELRMEKGLDAWTMTETPFARVGVTLGYVSKTLKGKKS